MSTSGADSDPQKIDFVDLSKYRIPTPPGWSNNRADLDIPGYFAPGCLMSRALEALGYTNVLPIITDGQDNYFVQAQIGTGKTIFTWNAISGRVMTITEDWELKDIMDMVGRSPLNIRMTLSTTT